jgi:hypothetical protein
MSAVNSGVTPDSGFTYANVFLFYARDQLVGTDGETVATGKQAVILDMNSFIWVTSRTILGGARFSLSATLPIANNSLTSDEAGGLGGGGGFGDSYYQPFILGWQKKRIDFRIVYGFLAPTGRYSTGGSNNVGSAYWTHAPSSGQTFYLTKDKATALSAFQMYEFHTTQEGTHIHPGQTFDLDYSLTRMISLREDLRLQIGLAGYGLWQTTDKSGPAITPAQASAHYVVNAIGFACNAILPARKTSLGVRYFKEYLNRSTFQGYSLQISGAVTF